MSAGPKHSYVTAYYLNINDIYTCKDCKRFMNHKEKTQHPGYLDWWEDLVFQVCMTNFNIFFFFELFLYMCLCPLSLSLSLIVKWIGSLREEFSKAEGIWI